VPYSQEAIFVKTKTIRQAITLPASPEEVYDAWMDSKKHSAFTGGKAVISQKVDGAFTVFDGYASGKNLALVPGKKIVQSWKAAEGGWPDEYYSELTVSLKAKGKATVLSFVQTGVPEGSAADVAQGWKDYYWTPLKEFFKK
jgi:activator of HSP90 ATPase